MRSNRQRPREIEEIEKERQTQRDREGRRETVSLPLAHSLSPGKATCFGEKQEGCSGLKQDRGFQLRLSLALDGVSFLLSALVSLLGKPKS